MGVTQQSKTHQLINTLVFDAYGTLFDVHSVIALCNELFPGRGDALSQTWRTKQLEYTWLRALMRRYEDFRAVTESALRFACKTLDLPWNQSVSERLMEAYLHLDPYPEVKEGLRALSGYKLAILSNGCPDMLDAVVKNTGLDGVFDQVISVDEIKIYKPDPRVYQMASEKLGVEKNNIGFVSSNFWDGAGAAAFGLRTFWINRSNAKADELGYTPGATIHQLTELPKILAG